MKKIIVTVLLLAICGWVSGCAMGMAPVTGTIYSDVSGPITATEHSSRSKMGKAKCQSLLGAIATGNCSVEEAKRNGGIRSVSTVDYHTKSILGLFAETTVIVTGS